MRALLSRSFSHPSSFFFRVHFPERRRSQLRASRLETPIRVRGSIRGLAKKSVRGRGEEREREREKGEGGGRGGGVSGCRREQEDFVVTMNGVNQTKAALD